MILTGPNMAGKSTFLRQVGADRRSWRRWALRPRERGPVGVVDRIFTRVGAQDNLARGQSHLHGRDERDRATPAQRDRASLVLLDEIGRGTSTYDGVRIAWAVTEYLHDGRRQHDLRDPLPRADAPGRDAAGAAQLQRRGPRDGRTRSSSCTGSRRAAPTAPTASRSAGWPDCPRRWSAARGRSWTLEAAQGGAGCTAGAGRSGPARALRHSGVASGARRLRDLDVDSMTPLEALNLLAELKREAGPR